VKNILGFKNGFLCVLTESDTSDRLYGVQQAKEWQPIHAAEEPEVRGIYVDEDVFQLAENEGANRWKWNR
jgi:hypothetical protein